MSVDEEAHQRLDVLEAENAELRKELRQLKIKFETLLRNFKDRARALTPIQRRAIRRITAAQAREARRKRA